MKITINELKLQIAQLVVEAKKKKEKEVKNRVRGEQIEAYGLYDEALDFSNPLGAYNLYRQQGAVNWGPQTSPGPQIDSTFANPNTGPTNESDERFIRSIIREVIANGLVPNDSAWSPMLEREAHPEFDSIWETALHWYDKAKEPDPENSKPSKGFEKSKYALDKKAQEKAGGKKKAK